MTPSLPDEPGPSRGAWVSVGAAWIVGATALLAWLARTSAGSLREELKVLQFWSLEICVFLGVVVGAVILPDLLRGLEWRDCRRLAILAVLAIGLTLYVAPRTNRIYYDEQIYQGIGQNLADLKLAQVCNDGAVQYGRLQCSSGEYNKQPYAYPHALSLVYRVFGVGPTTAFVLNAVVMALTVCTLYLVVFVLFGDRQAAFYAGLLAALTPEQIVWSATAAVEPSAALACVVAVLGAAYALRSRSPVALASAAIAAAYAVQFRPESFLIVAVVGLLLWPRLYREITGPAVWWVGLLFLGLVAVHVGHLFAVRDVPWGTSAPRLSLAYVASNLRVNGWFYLWDERFPVVFTLLAAIGVAGRQLRLERLSFLLYFFLFFATGLLFYAGSYNYGADVRYSLMTYPPLFVLGGLGAARVEHWVARIGRGFPARQVLTAALLFQFLWYAPLVRATTEEAWAARADVRFAKALASELPPNSYVLTHNPGMFHVWGIDAGQLSLVGAVPSYVNVLADRYAGGVYVHWNFWCNAQDVVQQELCRKALETFPAELVREYRERDQRFAIYRLAVPKP